MCGEVYGRSLECLQFVTVSGKSGAFDMTVYTMKDVALCGFSLVMTCCFFFFCLTVREAVRKPFIAMTTGTNFVFPAPSTMLHVTINR